MEDFLPGDEIEFIDDKTRGFIISLLDNHTLLVDIEDGLEIPVPISKVVRISTSGNKPSKTDTARYTSGSENKIPENKFNKNLIIAMLNNEKADKFRFILINNTRFFYYFTFYKVENDNYTGISKGQILSGEYCTLTEIELSGANKFPGFSFTALPFKPNTKEGIEPIIYRFKPDGEKLVRNQGVAPLLNETACLFEITEKTEQPLPLVNKPVRIEAVFHDIIDIDQPEKIIDLHIKEINPDYKLMTGSEILNFQFEYFKNALEKAIALKYPKIIFIHGIGVSTLKNKIIDHLKDHHHIKSHNEADIRKFGYGAMEVEIKIQKP